VAKWVYEIAQKRADAEFELVDIKDYNLPLLDEPVPPSMGQYSKPHTKAWAAKIGSFDGYVFVAPEYNHGISGATKSCSPCLATLKTSASSSRHEKSFNEMFDQVVAWGGALKALREK